MPRLFKEVIVHAFFFLKHAHKPATPTGKKLNAVYDNHFSLFAEPNRLISMTTYLFNHYQIAALIPVKSEIKNKIKLLNCKLIFGSFEIFLGEKKQLCGGGGGGGCLYLKKKKKTKQYSWSKKKKQH